MKIKSINVFVGGLLLSLGTTALANEKSVFVRANMQEPPAWFVTSNEITDATSGLSYKAEMLSETEVRWTVGNLDTSGNDCKPIHLLGYRGRVNYVEIDTPSVRRDACTASFDMNNTTLPIVDPGRINMWTTYIDGLGESILDIRQIEINDLSTMTISNDTGVNDSIVDQTPYIDASRVELTRTYSYTVGMRLDVVSSNGSIRYSKEFFNSFGGGEVVGRLPNAALCNVSGTYLTDTTLRVYRIDNVRPSSGPTASLVSTYSGQCQNL